MNVGTIAPTTTQGLGLLAKSFYDNGIVTHVGTYTHTQYDNHPEWYPSNARFKGSNRRGRTQWRRMLEQVDSLLFFESAFDWKLIQLARGLRKRTALMPMYECTPELLPSRPDLIIAPSLLDQDYYRDSIHIPVPVDVPWRLRKKAHTFVHNAGNLGLNERNGTRQLLQAMKLVKSPAKLILRSQTEQMKYMVRDCRLSDNVEVRYGTVPFSLLWEEGDVFVWPEKFSGLSLPLQEAHAAGMLVMTTDRYPHNRWLPNDPMIPVGGTREVQLFKGARRIDEYRVHPQDIADTIDEWYDRDIESYSLQGKQWALQHTWNILKPRYMEALQ